MNFEEVRARAAIDYETTRGANVPINEEPPIIGAAREIHRLHYVLMQLYETRERLNAEITANQKALAETHEAMRARLDAHQGVDERNLTKARY